MIPKQSILILAFAVAAFAAPSIKRVDTEVVIPLQDPEHAAEAANQNRVVINVFTEDEVHTECTPKNGGKYKLSFLEICYSN